MNQLIASAVASACLLAAQDAPRPHNTYHSSGGASTMPRLVSPEVRLDRTIIFRLRAPEVAKVTLSFGGSKPMAKDDAGVWSATVGPMDPEICQYNFVVDGVQILDPGNPNLKNGRTPTPASWRSLAIRRASTSYKLCRTARFISTAISPRH